MRKRFCPKCGATITEGTFCQDCISKEIHYEPPLVQVSEFNRVFEQGRWKYFADLEEVIKRRVAQALGQKQLDMEIEPFEFTPAPKQKTVLHVHLVLDGVELRLPVKLSYMQCDFGQKEKTGYFEGILQLRNPTDEVRDFIERDLKSASKKGVFISKTAEMKKGVDLYFTNKNHMKLLAQRIHNAFGGVLKINSQLFSHNHETSKDIFRVNAYVELPLFKKNGVVSFIPGGARNQDTSRHYFRILSLGKLVQAYDLLFGKRVAFEERNVSELKIESIHSTKIILLEPQLQVLHPESFQAETVMNESVLKKDYSVDDEVSVVISEKGLLIVE